MMQCSRKLKVTDLNPHLICVLCGGYYVDATTIIECLHSFCKSCIVRYLETNKYCPICDVQVHKTRPLQNIRPDDTLQTIVYKLVPGLYQNEMRCRRNFYAEHPEAVAQTPTPEARGELTDESRIFLPDEPVSLCLEYVGASSSDGEVCPGPSGRRYLRCPAAVSVFHIQKLIRAKFSLAMGHRVDIFYNDDLLPESWTLMDIGYIYQWKRKSPVHLGYQILESQRKRIKLSHSATAVSETESSSVTEDAANNVCDNNSLSVDCVALPLETASTVTSTMTTVTPTALSVSTPSVKIAGVVATTVTSSTTTTATVTTTAATSTTKVTVTGLKKEPCVEWKEVQLQISENGVMSVAGVENNRLLTPMQPISVSSQSDNDDNLVNKISVEGKAVTDEMPENKVPPADIDVNSSALHDKNISVVQSELRTKAVESPATNLETPISNSTLVSKSDVDTELKTVTKDNTNSIDNLKPSSKFVGYKLPVISERNNPIFKSKTDKLEDTVRNISSRTEFPSKSDSNCLRSVATNPTQSKDDNVARVKIYNSEQSCDGVSGNVHRPLTSHKVYPGVKSVYSTLPKEEHVKVNIKSDSSLTGTKLTPMEVLNTHKKSHNQTVKYKTLKTPIKPWNPSIPRAAALSMKHTHSASNQSKDTNSTGTNDGQQNPPPPKQPRFFKIRNMPRFLGNPSSGVKPMYQVAPGSEIVSHATNPNPASTSAVVLSTSSSSSTTVTATVVVTTVSSIASTITVTTVPTSTVSCTNASSVTPSAASTNTATGTVTSSSSASSINTIASVNNSNCLTAGGLVTLSTVTTGIGQKNLKQSSNSGITLMKIDPKTLSPITMTPTVSHVLNHPPRSTSSPQPKKLPPPFTPGSPKHSTHYTNCRTAHSNSGNGKSSVPRIPSPAHTGLIPTNPFLHSVAHSNHLLYSPFPNPFTSADPSGSRLITGHTNSELIRAMSALCSSGSAFHPSLPPSISMLFNPHHAHHRSISNERSGFKCNSNEKQNTQSPPPAIQRIPPSNLSGKGFTETDLLQVNLNSASSFEQPSNNVKLKKDKLESSAINVVRQSQTNNLPPKKPLAENIGQLQQQSQLCDLKSVANSVAPSVPNFLSSEAKNTKTSQLLKPRPGEKIEEVTSELLVHKIENIKASNKTANGSCIDNKHNDIKHIDNKEGHCKSMKHEENKNESKSKDEHLVPNNNNNCNNKNPNGMDNSNNINSSSVTESM
ncbi:uncharacterized protein LOC142329332 [Lycorma delicatula]|uniref:uncharacterized protein LOC142329332 n=1 Tax=Lycorma delicatula TaxID=130591 RepID=UPI003F51418F